MGLRIENVFETEGSSGMAKSGGNSGLDSGSCEFLGEALDSLDTCHHRYKGQILTATRGHCSILCPILLFPMVEF